MSKDNNKLAESLNATRSSSTDSKVSKSPTSTSTSTNGNGNGNDMIGSYITIDHNDIPHDIHDEQKASSSSTSSSLSSSSSQSKYDIKKRENELLLKEQEDQLKKLNELEKQLTALTGRSSGSADVEGVGGSEEKTSLQEQNQQRSIQLQQVTGHMNTLLNSIQHQCHMNNNELQVREKQLHEQVKRIEGMHENLMKKMNQHGIDNATSSRTSEEQKDKTSSSPTSGNTDNTSSSDDSATLSYITTVADYLTIAIPVIVTSYALYQRYKEITKR